MLRSQRILVIVGLMLGALVLHVGMCDWKFNDTIRGGDKGNYPIWYWHVSETPATSAGGGAYIRRGYTGLFSQDGTEPWQAMFLGVLLPLALVFAAAYLWLGGRHAGRISRGLCIKCGYDLRGVSASATGGPGGLAKCPECGTPVP